LGGGVWQDLWLCVISGDKNDEERKLMFWINLQTLLFIAGLAAVIFSAAAYSNWMKEHYGCTPCTLGSCVAGLAAAFLALMVLGSKGGVLTELLVWLIVLAIVLILYANNRQKCGSNFHGAMMTLWQLAVGGLALFFLLALTEGRGRKK